MVCGRRGVLVSLLPVTSARRTMLLLISGMNKQARQEMYRAISWLLVAGLVGGGGWLLWRRRRARLATDRAMLESIRGGEPLGGGERGRAGAQTVERGPPIAAAPTLHPCVICHARARDCVLLDCRHQVCCLQCSQRLASHCAGAEHAGSAHGEGGELGGDDNAAVGGEVVVVGPARCPVCAAAVRQVLPVFSS